MEGEVWGEHCSDVLADGTPSLEYSRSLKSVLSELPSRYSWVSIFIIVRLPNSLASQSQAGFIITISIKYSVLDRKGILCPFRVICSCLHRLDDGILQRGQWYQQDGGFRLCHRSGPLQRALHLVPPSLHIQPPAHWDENEGGRQRAPLQVIFLSIPPTHFSSAERLWSSPTARSAKPPWVKWSTFFPMMLIGEYKCYSPRECNTLFLMR